MSFLEASNPIDIFILATVLITFILGFWKGFVRSLTALTGLAVGVWAATAYYPLVQYQLTKISSLNPQISVIISMVLVFVLTQVVFVVIRRVLEAILDFTRLGWLDRILGSAMGVVTGLLIAAASVQIALIAAPEWKAVKSSVLAMPIEGMTYKLLAYVPQETRNQVNAMILRWRASQESPQQDSPRFGAQLMTPGNAPDPGRR
ncbi:MAG: CvpA family protein [Desulfomonilaceae bacterium]|jgi:membrane protein required for colicin V production